MLVDRIVGEGVVKPLESSPVVSAPPLRSGARQPMMDRADPGIVPTKRHGSTIVQHGGGWRRELRADHWCSGLLTFDRRLIPLTRAVDDVLGDAVAVREEDVHLPVKEPFRLDLPIC